MDVCDAAYAAKHQNNCISDEFTTNRTCVALNVKADKEHMECEHQAGQLQRRCQDNGVVERGKCDKAYKSTTAQCKTTVLASLKTCRSTYAQNMQVALRRHRLAAPPGAAFGDG